MPLADAGIGILPCRLASAGHQECGVTAEPEITRQSPEVEYEESSLRNSLKTEGGAADWGRAATACLQRWCVGVHNGTGGANRSSPCI